MNNSDILKTAKDAALSAGKIIMDVFHRSGAVVKHKEPHNLVSEADLAAEEEIIRVIRERFPDHAFYDVFKVAFDSMDESAKRKAMRAYYAGISYMDEQLGLVMEHMEKRDLLKNTVIVFMGDHGYQVGEKNYWNK